MNSKIILAAHRPLWVLFTKHTKDFKEYCRRVEDEFGLDDVAPGVHQDSIGVWLGPEETVTVVEVIGERL